MKTEGVKENLQVYCLKNWKHKVVLSEMRKNTKGIDFERVSEIYLRHVKFDMFINRPSKGVK